MVEVRSQICTDLVTEYRFARDLGEINDRKVGRNEKIKFIITI